MILPTLDCPLITWRKDFGCHFAVDRTIKPRFQWWYEGLKGDEEVLAGRTVILRMSDSNKGRTPGRFSGGRRGLQDDIPTSGLSSLEDSLWSHREEAGGGMKRMTSCGMLHFSRVPKRFSTFRMISSH